MRKTKFLDAERIVNAITKEIPLEDIKLDSNNVRFLHVPKTLSDKEIEETLWKESDTKTLYKQILSAGGVYEEPVLDSNLIVIEGNRRIACLRKLKKEANRGELPSILKNQFDKVKCKILPKEISQQEKDLFLATIHVNGKKPWNAFNKAKHIFNLYDSGLSYDDLYRKLNMGKATVIRAVESYKATEKYGKKYNDENWFRKFTYFDELYKRKDLKEFRKEPKNLEKFENWVYHEKLDDVREVRQLAKILQDKDSFKEFEKKGFDEAMIILSSKDPSFDSVEFKKIKDTIDVLRDFSRRELSRTVNDVYRIKLLNSLKKEIDSLLKDIKSMKKTS